MVASDYIILNGDNIKRSLKRNEKSADRIIFLKESLDKNVDLIICELSFKKRYDDVVNKIKKTGECIIHILKKLGYKVKNIKCVFAGKYKNHKRVKPKPFSIPNFGKNNLFIKHVNCGGEFSDIF